MAINCYGRNGTERLEGNQIEPRNMKRDMCQFHDNDRDGYIFDIRMRARTFIGNHIRNTGVNMATVRQEYQRPQAPVEKCSICQGPLKPIAIYDADAREEKKKWILSGWDCDYMHNLLYGDVDHEWPFLEPVASWKDFEAAGFVTM
jgi:hypothetical protein